METSSLASKRYIILGFWQTEGALCAAVNQFWLDQTRDLILQCCTMPASNEDVSLDVIFNNKANAQGLNFKSNCQNATNTLFPKMALILDSGFVWVFFSLDLGQVMTKYRINYHCCSVREYTVINSTRVSSKWDKVWHTFVKRGDTGTTKLFFIRLPRERKKRSIPNPSDVSKMLYIMPWMEIMGISTRA